MAKNTYNAQLHLINIDSIALQNKTDQKKWCQYITKLVENGIQVILYHSISFNLDFFETLKLDNIIEKIKIVVESKRYHIVKVSGLYSDTDITNIRLYDISKDKITNALQLGLNKENVFLLDKDKTDFQVFLKNAGIDDTVDLANIELLGCQ